jgi:hypothetical protein
MNETIIIDGVNVAECDRYCKFDNRNEPNKCYSYIFEGYNDCKPKEYQCFFYVKEIEKQLQRLKAENEKLKDCFRFLETNLTIIRNDFLTCMSECLAALEDESEVQQ